MFNKGDILVGTHREPEKAKHPIIFIEQIDEVMFIGCMLTHRRRGNVGLNKNHFALNPDDSNRNSFFVNRLLLKENEWGPFEVAGRLSETGIEFLEANLGESEPISWEEAIKNVEN